MNNKNEFTIYQTDKLNMDKYMYSNSKKQLNFINSSFLLFIKLIILSLFIIIMIITTINNIINDKINNKIAIIEGNQKLLLKYMKYNYLSKNLKNQKKREFINIFIPMEVNGLKKIRIGKNSDGGYILLDDLQNLKIAYSFGISNEVSFDQELADKNIDIFMYDHTISNLPYNNPKFHWQKLGLSGETEIANNTKKLDELIEENGHSNEKNMILKMDIESSEWDVFQDISSNILKQFKFIIGEFHLNNKNKFIQLEVLKKLKTTHQIFHLHCNNCINDIIYFEGYYICPFLEISFIQKEGFNFSKLNSSFPINGLDYKNCENNEELDDLLNIFI